MDRGDGMQDRLEIAPPAPWFPKRAVSSWIRSVHGLATMRYIGASRFVNFGSLCLRPWFVVIIPDLLFVYIYIYIYSCIFIYIYLYLHQFLSSAYYQAIYCFLFVYQAIPTNS